MTIATLVGDLLWHVPSDPPLDPNALQGCDVARATYLVRQAAIYVNDHHYENFIESDMEDLTKVGELEAFKIGVDIKLRYHSFGAAKKVWASIAERTELSAQSFIEVLVLTSNETHSVSAPESERFKKIHTKPIIEWFNNPAPGFNFTADDITVIRGSSPFYSLDYTNKIPYHHNTGRSIPISGVLGHPWANAPETLPEDVPERDLYISFTHRELVTTVIVALVLFINQTCSANVPVKKMSCDSYRYELGEYVRVLVNQGPNNCSKAVFKQSSKQGQIIWQIY
ncbi:phosphoglycerate mutase-like protein [Lojkania enalia]|uniref:Phosphoglycerate mutase-like protein n=1 Tax=Lojkania enalia TaxID=147567 RepID=A0A9P4KA32_9PLEO|nr:phosphoglycerate mutase-like protein [Didymosphaeria enalia]